jgi:hypothetical protein
MEAIHILLVQVFARKHTKENDAPPQNKNAKE